MLNYIRYFFNVDYLLWQILCAYKIRNITRDSEFRASRKRGTAIRVKVNRRPKNHNRNWIIERS